MCDWEQTAFKSVWVKYASKLECLLTHQKWQTNKKSTLKSIKLASVDSEKPKNDDATEQNKIPKSIIHLPEHVLKQCPK